LNETAADKSLNERKEEIPLGLISIALAIIALVCGVGTLVLVVGYFVNPTPLWRGVDEGIFYLTLLCGFGLPVILALSIVIGILSLQAGEQPRLYSKLGITLSILVAVVFTIVVCTLLTLLMELSAGV
jgi:hypothetical protein